MGLVFLGGKQIPGHPLALRDPRRSGAGRGVKDGVKEGIKDGVKDWVKDGFNPLLPAGSPQPHLLSRGCFSPSPFAVFS